MTAPTTAMTTPTTRALVVTYKPTPMTAKLPMRVGSIRFRCGDLSELSVFRRPGLTTEHTLAHFEVTDIEATVRDLESKGVMFVDYTEGPLTTTGHIAQMGPARGARFRDPDGNFLGLRQG